MAEVKKGAAKQAPVPNQQQLKAPASNPQQSKAPAAQSKAATQQSKAPASAKAAPTKSAAASAPPPAENVSDGEEYIYTGTVKWFNATRGFGFITPSEDGPEIFVHQTSIYASGFRSLREGEAVEYAVETGDDGRLRAVSVSGPNGDYVQGDSGGRSFNGGGGNGGIGENAGGGGSGGRAQGGRAQGRGRGRGRGRGPSGDGRCFNCNQEGHFARDCTSAAAAPRQGCYSCGEQGHFARDCPNRS